MGWNRQVYLHHPSIVHTVFVYLFTFHLHCPILQSALTECVPALSHGSFYMRQGVLGGGEGLVEWHRTLAHG